MIFYVLKNLYIDSLCFQLSYFGAKNFNHFLTKHTREKKKFIITKFNHIFHFHKKKQKQKYIHVKNGICDFWSFSFGSIRLIFSFRCCCEWNSWSLLDSLFFFFFFFGPVCRQPRAILYVCGSCVVLLRVAVCVRKPTVCSFMYIWMCVCVALSYLSTISLTYLYNLDLPKVL